MRKRAVVVAEKKRSLIQSPGLRHSGRLLRASKEIYGICCKLEVTELLN